MVIVKTFISKEKPAVLNGLWLKPTDGGFTLILIDGGTERPLNINSNDAKEKNDIIGSVQDEKTANTINGAKAYAKDLKNTITGNPGDDSTDLTLYGLRTLIEERTAKKYGNKNKQE